MNRRAWLVVGVGFIAAWFARAPRKSIPPDTLPLATLLGRSDPTDEFERASARRGFVFPEDHGPHRAFQQEWWYFSGNLVDDAARAFGFQFTIFRFALHRAAQASVSAWRTQEIFLAHFSITDVQASAFHRHERLQRASLSLAGASETSRKIWLKNWQIAPGIAPDSWQIEANAEGEAIKLDLTPEKPLVLQGQQGLSQKGAAPGNASYYYSQPRLAAHGQLRCSDGTHHVHGQVWLDREWGTNTLDPAQVGWDWFGLQFANQCELMLYRLRRRDGAVDPHNAGTWSAADGTQLALAASDFTVRVLKRWTSPETKIEYPAGWRMVIPKLALDFEVRPRLNAQEWNGLIHYWEGAVSCHGSYAKRPLEGLGYAELTGYNDYHASR